MNTTHKVSGLAVVALILVTATAFVLPGGSDRANSAWSARLSGQAAQEQEQARSERALAAWSARLTAQVASLKDETLQVEAARAARAMKAWSDRLTGQAEAEAEAAAK
jgi:hypothetical protein